MNRLRLDAALLNRLPPARRHWAVAGLVLFLVLAVLAGSALSRPGPAAAPALAPADQPAGMAATPDWESALWAVMATGLVVAAIYGSMWALRAINQQRTAGRRPSEVLQLRTSLRVGTNQTLHVVQFGHELLLVGAAQGGLSLLTKMPADEPEPEAGDMPGEAQAAASAAAADDAGPFRPLFSAQALAAPRRDTGAEPALFGHMLEQALEEGESLEV